MSTTTDHADHSEHADRSHPEHDDPAMLVDGAHVIPGEHHGTHSDAFYVQIAVVLAVITAVEVLLSYTVDGPLFLPALLILMTIKFFMVVLFFMHLKFDSKWFSFFFYAGLFLAVGVYLAFLATFKFFVSS